MEKRGAALPLGPRSRTARRRPHRHGQPLLRLHCGVRLLLRGSAGIDHSAMKDLPTPIIAVAVCVLLFVAERFFPLRKTTRSLIARLGVNLAISVFTFITAAGLLQPAVHWAVRWSVGKPFGFVHLVALPSPVAFV